MARFLFIVVLCLLASQVGAQDEDDELFAPGLVARYAANDQACERLDRQVSFQWGNATPDRRLRPGPFQATWRGYLLSQVNGEYRLHVFAAGDVRVTLRGKNVIDARRETPGWVSSAAVKLEYDYQPFEVHFASVNDRSQLALFWSGPQFSLEPIDGRQFFHDRDKTPSADFEWGASLSRSLRCGACHVWEGEHAKPLAAPSLEHVNGSLHPQWLSGWLAPAPSRGEATGSADRMSGHVPEFSWTSEDAALVASWLSETSRPLPPVPPPPRKDPAKGKEKSKPKVNEKNASLIEPEQTPVELGRELAVTLGCLACHQLDGLGAKSPFSGGDLSQIAAKRPADFFRRWLTEPASLNPDHRMPVFDLTPEEREPLIAFLISLKGAGPPGGSASASSRPARVSPLSLAEQELARQLVQRHQCGACHSLPGKQVAANAPPRTPLAATGKWESGCVAEQSGDRRPHFTVTPQERAAMISFFSEVRSAVVADNVAGGQLLVEQNCLACHQRGESAGLAPRLIAVGERHPELAPSIPAMTPPSLLSVGDKLHDETLTRAVVRDGPPHRPYLRVRMPKFRLTDGQVQQLTRHLIGEDRIPDARPEGMPQPESQLDAVALHSVGSRLVTADGFGCTSCHQIGEVLPVKAPLNARGPDLSQMGKRVRREWYERWVRNPARIVPRMEMPSVQIAVRGMRPESLDAQLNAVWEVLNLPGFEPPIPNPVRVARQTGMRPTDRGIAITDVLRQGNRQFVKPLLIGLANRHNIQFDLETGRLRGWSVGDTARQRTEGKSWYWEAAGLYLWELTGEAPEIELQRPAGNETPRRVGQFLTELDELRHDGPAVSFRYRLRFGESNPTSLQVTQSFAPLPPSSAAGGTTGFQRILEVTGAAGGEKLRVSLVDDSDSSGVKLSKETRQWGADTKVPWQVIVKSPSQVEFQRSGVVITADSNGTARLVVDYTTQLFVDQFVVDVPPPGPIQPEQLAVVPGFAATRLPLTDEIMPTALTFRPNGSLVIASLKGQVWQARDTNGDGLADQLAPLSDELAAPYGLFATDDYVDVVNKYALVRLFDRDGDGFAETTTTLASGWGHTTDYHDWAVGLPRDEEGRYYVALPCQQDQRSDPAAKHRGDFLRLTPRSPTTDDPRTFQIEVVSRGHRFPMGIARRRDGQLFVTDNQGNYNPFNELNWVREGAHFGFINALEKGTATPPLTNPAINLPHPWTRSVNGICFLETPEAVREQRGLAAFGPFEGDLIGCEYDTRRLIRMSLQRVGDQIQGAAYPFSYDQPPDGPPLLGPLVCTVSPAGELYVGGIRDSGWGGANNIGEVVRLQLTPETLPCGIARMEATSNGFTLEFISPVDRTLAADTARYSLASYTRQSTPAYGGPDLHRRVETVHGVEVAPDGRSVRLEVGDLRAGYVYELHLKSLVDRERPFFPAEAHYTLNVVP